MVARAVTDASAILRLDTLLERWPAQLSGGQRQRHAMPGPQRRDPPCFQRELRRPRRPRGLARASRGIQAGPAIPPPLAAKSAALSQRRGKPAHAPLVHAGYQGIAGAERVTTFARVRELREDWKRPSADAMPAPFIRCPPGRSFVLPNFWNNAGGHVVAGIVSPPRGPCGRGCSRRGRSVHWLASARFRPRGSVPPSAAHARSGWPGRQAGRLPPASG